MKYKLNIRIFSAVVVLFSILLFAGDVLHVQAYITFMHYVEELYEQKAAGARNTVH